MAELLAGEAAALRIDGRLLVEQEHACAAAGQETGAAATESSGSVKRRRAALRRATAAKSSGGVGLVASVVDAYGQGARPARASQDAETRPSKRVCLTPPFLKAVMSWAACT